MNEEEKTKTFKIFEELQSDRITREKVKKAESKVKFLGDMASDFKILLDLIKAYWNGTFKIEYKELAILIGAISYVALPLDAIPDFLPLIGFTDDMVVVGLVISQLKELIDRFKSEKEDKLID